MSLARRILRPKRVGSGKDRADRVVLKEELGKKRDGEVDLSPPG